MNKSGPMPARMAAVVFGAGLTAVVLLMGAFIALTTNGFLEVERHAADSAMRQIKSLLESQVSVVDAAAADYAQWDDTWRFLNGLDGDYPARNFSAGSLANLRIDVVALYDAQGSKRFLLAPGNETVGAAFPDSLDSSSPIFDPQGQGVQGLALLDSRPYLVSSRRGYKSDASGPAAGRIIFARHLGEGLERELGLYSGAAVRFIPLPQGAAQKAAEFERSGLRDPVVRRIVLPDVDGREAVLMELHLDRLLFRRGHQLLTYFVIIALLIVAVISAAFALAVRRVIAADRSAARILEEEIRGRTRELTLYKRILQQTGEGIVITDLDGIILEANPAFSTMTGYGRQEFLGKSTRIIKSGRHEKEFYAEMWRTITAAGRWEGELWNRRKDGTLYPVWLSIDTIKDEADRPERYIGIMTDISRMKEAESTLNRLAFYDALTGLPNRSLFQDRISGALGRAQRNKTRIALLYLDLDHFKDVNDGYGHQVGDQLLKDAAERIGRQVRDADTVCRLGGDEFTVILETIRRSDDAALVAKKIVDALRRPFNLEDREIYSGASIGIALYPFDGSSSEELVKRADAAMYEAKAEGRGQYRFASGEAGKSSRRRVEMETKLRRALRDEDFVLHFQPQVSSGSALIGSSRGLVGAEALIRMRDKNGAILSPDSFIETAEETGLIVPIGGWALKEACAEAVRWAKSGHPIPVSVNVSQRQFEKGVIVEQASAALKATGLDPRLLKLEVTESLFMRDMERAAATMHDLKALGITFAVDDFGTGYSSLRYIDALPIDSLKIDKSFIDRITTAEGDGAVALAVVSLARSFGLESVAEGVETMDQLEALRRRGCDTIQGFYVSRPLDPETFFTFMDLTSPPAVTLPPRGAEDEGDVEELESVL